jgi:ribosomal protein S18 acetylase RimI-like enzyme
VGELVRLGTEHRDSVFEFLARSPIENVMMMGVILEEGMASNIYREFVGYREAGEWLAVAYFSGDISLYAPDERAIGPMAEFALKRSPMVPRIISRKHTVDQFWEIFRQAPYPVLFDRRQLVYTLAPSDLPEVNPADIRLATLDDADEVAVLASAMSREEIQMDPLKDHPVSYHRLIEHRIRMQRYYVLEEGGAIKFQVHLNALTDYAGQVTGVYTPPAFRRKGYAQRGMGAFCQHALGRVPELCLFVNDFNHAAIKLYESLGFQSCMEYRAIFLDAGY